MARTCRNISEESRLFNNILTDRKGTSRNESQETPVGNGYAAEAAFRNGYGDWQEGAG